MAAASTKLYRTMSNSTASTSSWVSERETDVQTKEPSSSGKRQRRRKTKRPEAPASSTVQVKPIHKAILPGFVQATSLMRGQRDLQDSADSDVANTTDSKGRGEAQAPTLLISSPKASPSGPVRATEGMSSLSPLHSASSDPADTPLAVADASSLHANGPHGSDQSTLVSPVGSVASSTDELTYVRSPPASPPKPQNTLQKVEGGSGGQRASPFAAPFTGFDFLAQKNASFKNGVHPSPPATAAPSTNALLTGLGLHSALASSSTPFSTYIKAQEPVRQSQNQASQAISSGKKTTASPLTWSTQHKALDPPTLGSPTLEQHANDDESYLSQAITRASFTVSQDTILKELERKKQQQKAEKLAQTSSLSPDAQWTQLPSREAKDLVPEQDHDGVKRQDMATAQSGWTITAPQPSVSPALPDIEDDAAALQGVMPANGHADGTTSATADAEEDVDDAASISSETSLLIRNVVRDSDTRGWNAIDEVSGERSQGRQRLQEAICELNRRHRPSAATVQARMQVLHSIRRKLNGLLPKDQPFSPDFQYLVKPFGSTAYGLDTNSSDLDLCIIDPKRPSGFRNPGDLCEPDANESSLKEAEINSTTEDDDMPVLSPFQRRKKEKQAPWTNNRKTDLGLDPIYDVKRLANVLRRLGYSQVNPIPNAVVPIVKFVSPEGIKGDMNPNEQLGVRNSALLAEYVGYAPLVRPFLIFLKVWAKQRNINDPSGQKGPISLSSYSLVLMAIAYLQHAGIVPNLQSLEAIKEKGIARQVFWTKVPNKDAIKPGRRGGRKGKGDFRALATETTYVTKELLTGIPSVVVHTGKKRRDSSSRKVRRSPIGWESDASSDEKTSRGEQDVGIAPGSTALIELIEGFFEYYTGFPLEEKAVSVWRGKPFDRRQGYLSPALDSDGDLLPQLPKISVEEREELYEEAIREEDEEIYQTPTTSSHSNGVAHASSLSDESSDEGSLTGDEEVAASLAQIEAQMKALGVEDFGPSFETTHRREISRSATPKGHGLRVDKPERPSSPKRPRSPSQSTHGVAQEIPFPPLEDPEDFVEPPTWTHRLVVQDPFIHTRNTCMNIMPKMVALIWGEMDRAQRMIRGGEPLEKICLNVKKDAEYVPLFRQGYGALHHAGREALRQERQAKKQAKRERYKEMNGLSDKQVFKKPYKANRRERRAKQSQPAGPANGA